MIKDYLKTIPHYLLPKSGLTALAGQFANVEQTTVKNYLIKQFIERYQVNMQEALEESPDAYKTFNDFFIRRLKPDARIIADTDLVSPADGSLSETGLIEKGRLFQAKNRSYRASELLGCHSSYNQSFDNGYFMTIYLSPKDYHRVHMPMDAQLIEMTYLPGKLFSVQPSLTKNIPRLFARNERLSILFDTAAGRMSMVMVGATIVGSIATRWHGDISRSRQSVFFDYQDLENHERQFKKGEEMGYFKLGSTVILLFSNKENIQWTQTFEAGKTLRLGQALGNIYTQ